MMAAKKRRSGPSGPTVPESIRQERGQARINLRVRREAVDRLDALCEDSGYSRSEQVEALIDAETELGPLKKEGKEIK
jgi:Ribbon-helix-helix protein, copG family